VATTGEAVGFEAMNAGMSPTPFAGRPIEGVSFVHVNWVAVPSCTTAVVTALLQTTWSPGSVTDGEGCTVIVNVSTLPKHVTPPKVYSGVTVMVATTGDAVAFVATNAGMLPVPLPPKPIDVLSFVHLKAVAVPLKFTTVVPVPAHTSWFAGSLTTGVGFTVIEKLSGAPAQDPTTGVTVNVATNTLLVGFVTVNAEISPVPDVGIPIAVLSFVQLNVVAVPVKAMVVVLSPLHNFWLLIGSTTGVGLTVMVKF